MPPSPSALASSGTSTCKAFSRPDDAELRALRNRDPEAVEKWICGCRDVIRAYILRYADDAREAREAVQETLTRALEGLSSFRGNAKVSTWLHSIARNVILQHRRDDSRRTPTGSDELAWLNYQNDSGGPEGVPESMPDSRAERTERRELFYEALSELSPSYREIIRVRDLEEKTTSEAADELGLTEVNVRVRLHRARKKLGELLDLPTAPTQGGRVSVEGAK